MPILGIDQEKCIKCKLCIKECIRRFVEDEERDIIIFQDPTGTCILCGHCIAVCPTDAILYENFGDEPYTFNSIEKLENIISYDAAYKFLRAHRSIRHYKKDKVPEELLRKVVKVMQYAPTGGNLRAEKYAILLDPEKIHTLSEGIMEELLKHSTFRVRYEESLSIRKKLYKNPVFFDAPHVIFVHSSSDTFIEGIHIGIIVTYGRLAAESLGLGTCWNGWSLMAFQTNKKLLKLAGIRGKGWGAFTIGYPDISYKRCPPRRQKKIKGLD